MFKIFSIFVISVLLSACNPITVQTTDNYLLPQGLKDCKIYRLEGRGPTLQVVRCPQASTSTTFRDNKTNYTTSVE